MNIEILKNAGIDYDDGVKRFMGRSNLYTKTLSKFPKDGTMGRIHEDYKVGDYNALLQDAHEFKGMCGNMSMIHLAHTANVIVSMLRSGGALEEDFAAAMGELETEYATVREAVLAAMEVSE